MLSWKKITVGIKTCKKGKNINFFVNKQLIEANVKFLIEHYKKEFKWCINALHIEEIHINALHIEEIHTAHQDVNISDTSNGQKQTLGHNCFYILGKAKTLINFTPILKM